MNKRTRPPKTKFSAQALRQFAENRRVANKAVQKAIEENKKIGSNCSGPSGPTVGWGGDEGPRDVDT